MAKCLKEIATGHVYPWSESWAKSSRFVEVEVTEMQVPEPTVMVGDGPKPKAGKK